MRTRGVVRADTGTGLRRLLREEHGAIVVFGVFFAVFIVGMLYYTVGLGNAIYYRERLQDAADASAFGAAVIHARGMNTLALINMVMAAVLSVLVALRLIEGLVTVAMGVMLALSWLGGATAGVAAALETVRQPIHNAAEQAEPIVGQVLTALHTIGEVVRVIVPLGSNAVVIGDIARQYDNVLIGVAIPPRLTLPVQDDEYPYLCGKAGVMAGSLAMLPLSPILPGWVEDGMAGAIGALTNAASDWFCGDGPPPTARIEPQVVQGPRSGEMQQCADYRPPEGADNNAAGVELCRTAERADMMATPNPDTGLCREGDVVCMPVEDRGEASGTYRPREGSYCADEGQSERLDETDCPLRNDVGDIVADRSPSTPYGRRLAQTREHCRPAANKRGYWYLQRTTQVTLTWNAALGSWQDTRERGELTSVRNERDSTATPCGLAAGEDGWNASPDLSQPVCDTEDDLPPPPPPPPPRGPFTVDGGSYVEVLQILSCGDQTPAQDVQLEPLDLGFGNSEGGDGGDDGGDGQNRNPFRFEEGHLLGTSDMQIRSLIVGRSVTETEATRFSDHVVANTRWNNPASDQAAFLQQARRWGQLAVAQAEYYFDDRPPLESDRFADLNNDRDWLWVMGWTARIRRFRLSYEGADEQGNTVDADGTSTGSDDDQGSSGSLLDRFGATDLVNDLQAEASDGVGPGTACGVLEGDLGQLCSEADSNMRLFDDLFLH